MVLDCTLPPPATGITQQMVGCWTLLITFQLEYVYLTTYLPEYRAFNELQVLNSGLGPDQDQRAKLVLKKSWFILKVLKMPFAHAMTWNHLYCKPWEYILLASKIFQIICLHIYPRKLHCEMGEQDNVLHCICLRSSNLSQVLLRFGLFDSFSQMMRFLQSVMEILILFIRCLCLIRMHLIRPQGWLQYSQYFRLKYQHHSTVGNLDIYVSMSPILTLHQWYQLTCIHKE